MQMLKNRVTQRNRGAALSVMLGLAMVFATRAALAMDPQPTEVLQAEGGLLHDYRHGSESAFYYRLIYKGKVVRSQGSAFQLPKTLNVSIAQDRDTTGDSGDLSLRLERSAFDAKSAIFDALGVHSLGFVIPALQNMRGVAQANGRVEGGVLNLSVGLETPPAHPLRAVNDRLGTGVTNWIIAGI